MSKNDPLYKSIGLRKAFGICIMMWEHMTFIKTVGSHRDLKSGGKLTEWDKYGFG
jgi:hypothetical protein